MAFRRLLSLILAFGVTLVLCEEMAMTEARAENALEPSLSGSIILLPGSSLPSVAPGPAYHCYAYHSASGASDWGTGSTRSACVADALWACNNLAAHYANPSNPAYPAPSVCVSPTAFSIGPDPACHAFVQDDFGKGHNVWTYYATSTGTQSDWMATATARAILSCNAGTHVGICRLVGGGPACVAPEWPWGSRPSIGCYVTNQVASWTPRATVGAVTGDSCSAACQATSGQFAFAAVKPGACWCTAGVFTANPPQLATSCAPCASDPTSMCGSSTAYNVYNL